MAEKKSVKKAPAAKKPAAEKKAPAAKKAASITSTITWLKKLMQKRKQPFKF